MTKLGLIEKPINPVDWQVGGFTPIEDTFINPLGDWTYYLPAIESQNGGGFDRMACVSYSLLNCLEILYLANTKTTINFSDRALAKMSGTSKSGNDLETVFDTARHRGLLTESQWPDVLTSWDDYYKSIPQETENEAMDFLTYWDIYREWVPVYRKDLIKQALTQAPLQVTVKYANGSGILNPAGKRDHAVTIYKMSDDYYDIFDHYTQSRKKYHIDYEFGVILKPSLIPKIDIPMASFKQNALVFKTQGSGYNFGIYIDGKLLIGPTDDVIGVWTMRNKDFSNKVSVTLEEWNKPEHYDLKGNKLSETL
jgi:hypothetical protein